MQDNIGAVVKGEGLVKTFKDFWGRDKVKAIRGVDIVIPKGAVFGLLGPNGAGKSTLIKLILGHLYPTSGRLSVLGEDPRNVEIKYKIGYLPERSYLYKNLTAEETLYYFGEILNLSKDQIKSRSGQLLEMVGLQNAKKRYVGEFSHGMTRRMGLAQALLNDPDFIILDEPTAGLDPVGCREVKDLIITLGKRGKTILLTSHLLADVEDTCDELLMMYGGTVQSKGKVDELLADTNRIKVEFPADKGIDLKTIEKEISNKSKGQFSITSPRQSLEQYFLSVVNKSHKSKETSGAQQGAGVADYLKAGVEDANVLVEKPSSPIQQDEIKEDAPEQVDSNQNSIGEFSKPVEAKLEQVPEVRIEKPEVSTPIKEDTKVETAKVAADLPPKVNEVIQPEVVGGTQGSTGVESEVELAEQVEAKREETTKDPDVKVDESVTSEEPVEATQPSELSELKAATQDDSEPIEFVEFDDEEDSDLDEKLLDDLTI